MSTFPPLSPAEAEAYYRARLPGLHRQGDGVHLRAACPIHRGERDSLSVHTETWQWRCHAACDRGGYVWDLEAALTGLPFHEARAQVYATLGATPPPSTPLPAAPPPGPEKLERSHSYLDAQGQLLFEVQVYRRADGTKRVTQRRPDPEAPGRWLWKLGDVERPLYHLPQLRAADPTATVWVVEGERKVEYLERMGHVATCNPGGAKKWRANHAQELRGRHVLIVPDRNAPGREHAELVARSLAGLAASIRMAEPPVAEGLDIVDWFKEDMTRNWALELRDFAQGAPLWQLPAPASPATPPSGGAASGLDWVPPSGDDNRPAQAPYAEAWAQQHRERFAFERDTKRWFEYHPASGCWREGYTEDVSAAIATPLAERKLSYTASYVGSVLKIASWSLPAPEWDAAPHLLACANGVLDLRTRTLAPHSPSHGISTSISIPWEPSAPPGPILTWLREVLPDEQHVQLLRAWFNANVTGRTDVQRFVELVGSGGSGKGTILRLLTALLGKHNVHTTSLAALEGNRFETASLRNKKAAIITDTERYGGEVSTLKAITGGDQVREERKGVQQLPGFTPRCLITIAANDIFQAADYTSGLARRRITIRMFRSTPPAMQRDLDREFTPHLPGLLAWVLAMPEAHVTYYLKDTERAVPSILAARTDALQDTNPIAAWAEERLIHDPQARTRIGDDDRERKREGGRELYHDYAEWCRCNGYKPVANNRFSKNFLDLALTQLGLEGVKKHRFPTGYHILGVRFPDLGETPKGFVSNGLAAKANKEADRADVHPGNPPAEPADERDERQVFDVHPGNPPVEPADEPMNVDGENSTHADGRVHDPYAPPHAHAHDDPHTFGSLGSSEGSTTGFEGMNVEDADVHLPPDVHPPPEEAGDEPPPPSAASADDDPDDGWDDLDDLDDGIPF